MKDHISIFNHHIYEYKKGLHRMVLYTGSVEHRSFMEQRLNQDNIAFHTTEVTPTKVNCFFGDSACIEVIKSFGDKPLYEISDQQDFILGALLGYDLHQQCERFLERNSRQKLNNKSA